MLDINDVLRIYKFQVDHIIVPDIVKKRCTERDGNSMFDINRSWVIECLKWFSQDEVDAYFINEEFEEDFYVHPELGKSVFTIQVLDEFMPIYCDDNGQQYVAIYDGHYWSNGAYNNDLSIFIGILLREYEKASIAEYECYLKEGGKEE